MKLRLQTHIECIY